MLLRNDLWNILTKTKSTKPQATKSRSDDLLTKSVGRLSDNVATKPQATKSCSDDLLTKSVGRLSDNVATKRRSRDLAAQQRLPRWQENSFVPLLYEILN